MLDPRTEYFEVAAVHRSKELHSIDALRSRFPGVSQTEVARQQLLRRNLFACPVPPVRQVLHQRLCQAGDQDHPLRSIHFSCHIAMSRCGIMRDQLARADAFTGTMGLSILIDGVVHLDRSIAGVASLYSIIPDRKG